jgi:hypothetical protein
VLFFRMKVDCHSVDVRLQEEKRRRCCRMRKRLPSRNTREDYQIVIFGLTVRHILR